VVAEAERALASSATDFHAADLDMAEAGKAAEAAEAALSAADGARAEAQALEAKARAERSEAEGEASALHAEAAALARLVERETGDSAQVLDRVRVEPGYEAALGAALADDLRAPETGDGGTASGWVRLPGYPTAQSLPEGVNALTGHVTVPEVLARRMSQVGLVPRVDGPGLQDMLKPGQRLVSIEGDLWRWDGFRAAAEDAPSAAALRLQQINRLVQLKRDLEEATARAEGAARAHTVLSQRLVALTRADREAREYRRAADLAVAEASRRLSRAEADRNIADSKLASQRLAVKRHEDEATSACARADEARRVVAGLDDLDAAKARVEELRITVEAARMTMLTRRAAHDELKREGEARARRRQEINGEIGKWQRRLETAGKRMSELE